MANPHAGTRDLWVGVKTDSYQQMREFFADVAGVAVDHEQPDFAVFRFPNGDKLEIFGPVSIRRTVVFSAFSSA